MFSRNETESVFVHLNIMPVNYQIMLQYFILHIRISDLK
uniref:Uncharacterized protein n=1 Tax=Anguilla anguilla TaxID=7936 RepID=A0A0E9UCZ7_ANGAN